MSKSRFFKTLVLVTSLIGLTRLHAQTSISPADEKKANMTDFMPAPYILVKGGYNGATNVKLDSLDDKRRVVLSFEMNSNKYKVVLYCIPNQPKFYMFPDAKDPQQPGVFVYGMLLIDTNRDNNFTIRSLNGYYDKKSTEQGILRLNGHN